MDTREYFEVHETKEFRFSTTLNMRGKIKKKIATQSLKSVLQSFFDMPPC
jgi:hypothetical protein